MPEGTQLQVHAADTAPPAADRLRVTETFLSLQGEGPRTGFPAVFLRLGGCNLNCVWCDSWYTWRTADGIVGGEWRLRAAKAVASELRTLAGPHCQRLVVTGGEPLLQQGPLLSHLLPLLPDWQIEFETAGHVVPRPELLAAEQVRFNVSPKLPGSGNRPAAAENPVALAAFNAHARAVFKYVVAAEGDWQEMLAHIERFKLRRDQVGVMPEGTDDATLLARLRWLAPKCVAEGLRLYPRLQIHLFGNVRGT